MSSPGSRAGGAHTDRVVHCQHWCSHAQTRRSIQISLLERVGHAGGRDLLLLVGRWRSYSVVLTTSRAHTRRSIYHFLSESGTPAGAISSSSSSSSKLMMALLMRSSVFFFLTYCSSASSLSMSRVASA